MEKFGLASAERAGKALEGGMNTAELQRILGYVNIGLAIAHDSGVSMGHFGCGDFIQLAQTVNGMLLQSITPPNAMGPDTVTVNEQRGAPAKPALAV